MERIVKKYKKEGISLIVLFFVVAVTLFFSFDFQNFDISMPIAYNGGDEFLTYKNAKMLSEGSGWIFKTKRLGAPFGALYYDFVPVSLENVENILIKMAGCFTKDPIIMVNLTVFFLFFLTAFTAYFALRQLGVRNDMAVVGAVVFDFMYYHFIRLVSHFSLGAYEFVPLSILLCVWLWKDDKLFSFGKGFFRYKKNYVVLLFALLIANNGIGYYPFFTCLFLGITGLSMAVKEKRWQPVAKMLAMVGSIVAFMAVSMLPSIWYQLHHGIQPTVRVRGDSEHYAMKIIQLLIPYKDHGNLFGDFHREYYEVFDFNEAQTSYLGMMAGVGFLILLLAVLYRKANDQRRVFTLLVELNLFAVLFATMGGFSSIFANFVTSLVRSVNRISIFIGFIAIAAVCLLMTKFAEHPFKKYKCLQKAGCVLFFLFAVFALAEQIPEGRTACSTAYAEERASDQQFIQAIEDELPRHAMIYQLPYHPYPESGSVKNMSDYHLLTGFLYSDTLRWSYGGGKGRKSDNWNRNVAAMEYPEMIEALKEKGFAGLYVDKRAYDEAVFENLYNVINVCLGYEPESSLNKNLYFWKF